MKHELFIGISNNFRVALAFTDMAVAVFKDEIKMASTGCDHDVFGSYFQFNDVRCIPALFDLAKGFEA